MVHIFSLLQNVLNEDSYHFEYYITNDFAVKLLTFMKVLYKTLRKNIPDLSVYEEDLFGTRLIVPSIEGITLDLQETTNLLSESEFTPYNKPFPDSQAGHLIIRQSKPI